MELAVHTEILVFKKGILVAVASYWSLSHSFVFESHSKSVVIWVANPTSVP